jgi:hypothetical protein
MKKNDLRENYMLPMEHPIAIENMRRHISPSRSFDNLFEKDELEHIWKQAFSDNRSVRMNRNGTVLMAGNLHEIFEQYKEKIIKTLGNRADQSPAIGGNFFITPQQYGLHNDSIRPEVFENTLKSIPLEDECRKYTCWKNFLLPLWIGTHHDEEDGGQIVFFNQRDIGWAKVYNGSGLVSNIASVYEIVTDYTELQFYDGTGNPIDRSLNKVPFDKKLHKEFMNTPYDRLQGLSVEQVLNWVPGSPMTFDAVQLHNSNEGTKSKGKKMWNSKMAILLTFLIELDDDLLVDWRKEQKKGVLW